MGSLYFTSEILIPEELLEGANVLAAMMGITGYAELNSFSVNYEDPEGNKYCFKTFQTEEAWWDGNEKRTGVCEVVACKDYAVATEMHLSEVIQRPEWDEQEVLNMDAAYNTLYATEIVESVEAVEEPLPSPSKMLLLRGTGLRSMYNIKPIAEE